MSALMKCSIAIPLEKAGFALQPTNPTKWDNTAWGILST